MSKTLFVALLLALLVMPLRLSPSLAQGGCPVPNGEYDGTTSVNMDIRGYAEGQLVQRFTIEDTGDLSLNIDGCTVTDGTYTLNVLRTFMFYPGAPVDECRYTVNFSQASGSVVSSGGLPRIDVRWGQGITNPSDCADADTPPPATWQFSLAGPPQGQEIGGDFRIIYDDPDAQDYDELAQMFREQGFEVTLTKGWTLSREPQPSVLGLSASLRQFFLQGIPVTNRYTATIDWDDSPPGTARFILDGTAPQPMAVNGNTAVYDLPLGPIQRTGDIPISVEAEIDGRVDRADNLGPLTIVPVPAWANRFNFQAQPQSGSVLYRGEYRLPDQPLDAHVVLPAIIPYVGGTWGLLPTQLKVPLAASSLGTRQATQISAMGGFGLGNRTFTLNARGNVYGTITRDALQFESDPLTLSTSGILFREHLGLVAVVPGASAFFNVPVFGDLLKALDSTLGVTAEVRGSLAGRGRVGVTGDTLKLTEGTFDAGLRASASAGIDTPVAWAMVEGGGDGSLSMEFIPATRLVSCRVVLWFRAGAGALGFKVGPLTAEHPVYTCQVGGRAVLVMPAAQAAAMLRTTYGNPNSEVDERVVTREMVTNGLSETVLVTDADLQARPVLAAGANNRLALVWNSLGTAGAADVVSVRLYDGTAWGSAVTLSQTARPAFTPSAAFGANGNLLVAWAEAQTAPDPNGISVAFARSFEIVWAEVDAVSGQVTRQGRLATDDVMDVAPRLRVAQDGSVWLGWLHSPATNMAGTAASPNRVLAARWTGSGWTTAETAAQNLVGTLAWDLAPMNAEQVWMVADMDTDGNLSTAGDRELYSYRRVATGWAAPVRLTNDAIIDSSPLLALGADGQPILAWRHGDEVLGLRGDPTTTEPEVWFDGAAGVGPMLGSGQLLAGNDGALALLWPEATEDGQDLWLSRLNPQASDWSAPAPLFSTAEQRRSPSAALLPNGDIMVGLTAAPVTMQPVTVAGGGATTVPSVSEAASVLVARIPAGYVPGPGQWSLFLPLVLR